MELRHLRYFLAVAEELNFSRAAELLHVSQPPLSKQIRELEEELGVRLLNRTSRKVEITNAGRLLASEARIVLQRLEQTIVSMVENERDKRNQLVVGYGTGILHFMAHIMKVFQVRYPEVQLVARTMDTLRQIGALHEGNIAVGLITLRLPLNSEGLVFEPIFRDRFAAVMPADHPLAKKKAVSIRSLATETLILEPYNKNQRRHEMIGEMFRRSGITPTCILEIDNFHEALDLVQAGLGLSIMRASIKSMKNMKLEGVVFRDLEDSPILDIAIARKRTNRSQAVLKFSDVVKQNVGAHKDARKG